MNKLIAMTAFAAVSTLVTPAQAQEPAAVQYATPIRTMPISTAQEMAAVKIQAVAAVTQILSGNDVAKDPSVAAERIEKHADALDDLNDAAEEAGLTVEVAEATHAAKAANKQLMDTFRKLVDLHASKGFYGCEDLDEAIRDFEAEQ